LHNAPIQTQANAVMLAQVPASSAKPAAGVAGAERTKRPSELPVTVAADNVQVAAGEKRPAINAESATASAMQAGPRAGAGLVGGVMTTKAHAAPGVLCSLTADGVRCINGKRSTELHQPDAKLKTVASHGDVIWAGGDTLVRSEDGGATWKDVKKPSDESIANIVVLANGVFVRTASGAMWETTDNGATWTPSVTNK
jgi:hypothetical protein